MNGIEIYFLKTNIALIMFYLVYRLFFSGDTHWNVRRIYLLLAIVISFSFSFIPVDNWLGRRESVQTFIYGYVQLQEIEIAVQAAPAFHLRDILQIIYVSIGILFLFRILTQLISIFAWRLKGKKDWLSGIKIIRLKGDVSPFSFFGWIFINPKLHDENEQNEILTHEYMHVCQWHSIDMIIGELLSVVCWINPASWLLQNEMRHNLEFLADARVLQTGCNPKDYQYHLLRLSYEKSTIIKLANNFNVSPLKKRIIMMNKEKTSRKGLLKYSLIVPLVLVLILASNVQTIMASAKESMKSMKNVTESIQAINEKEVYDKVDVMPQFPDDMKGLMKYLSENIKYPADAIENNIEGRVLVRFIITATGEIADAEVLRSLYPSCDAEAVRIVEAMPKWTPGKKDGKDVAVYFTLPIKYALASKTDTAAKTIQGEDEKVVMAVGQSKIVKDGQPNATKKNVSGEERAKVVFTAPIHVSDPETNTTEKNGSRENKRMTVFTTRENEGPTTVMKQTKIVKDVQSNQIARTDVILINSGKEKPLIIVNGKEMSADFDVNTLSVTDIELIEVLKDAATTTYGEKGKNGVVKITMK